MSRINFHRPARVYPPRLPTEPVVLSAPPQPVGRDGGASWMYLLMPLLSSFSVAGYMIVEGRKTLIFLGIGFVLVSASITIGVRMSMRGRQRKAKIRGRDLYLRHLVEVRQVARQVAEDQQVVAAWAYPSPYRLWAIAAERRRVWERRSTDPDFLKVCVGVGRAPLSTPIRLATRNDPTVEYDKRAKSAVDRLIASMSTVGSQPALVDLTEAGVVSVLGPAGVGRGVVRAILCQIGVLHAPDDVGVVVVTGGEDWGWAAWLPHTQDPDAPADAVAPPLIAERFEGVADRLRAALDAAARRPDRPGLLAARQPLAPRRHLVVVLDRYDPRAPWARSPLAAELLAAAGPLSAISVLCVVEREADEPTRADVRVRVAADGSLTLDGPLAERHEPVTDAVADWPEPALCEAIARELAPLQLSVEGEEILAQVMSLPSMLGIADLDQFQPKELWVGADDEAVLQLPVGFDAGGRPLVLDLKEAAQGGMGPHGLIVGATGSGKSELLRTLVTGLSMKHSPDLLSFVLIDFKGGATFAGVTELPHVAGMITNLVDDLALVNRVLDALIGEQQRRQRILRDAGNVDTVREYQLRRAAGEPGPDGKPLEPLPYLLVIVDEFGELLARRPDFVDLFVQIGRVGRSLGMHLLLATQRLEEGKLRGLDANLSYRICLRTFSAAESRVVIGTQDAYRLPAIPGSAYLKVADAEPERFRVAHVSGPHQSETQAEKADARPPAQVVPLRLRGPADAEAAAENVAAERPKPLLTGPTQMQVIVERLCSYGQTAHQVWLPPLPETLPLDALTGPIGVKPDRGLSAGWWPHHGTLQFPVGVLDIPLRQLQHPLVHDFAQEHGNLAVVGAPQSGKSTFLRTLLLSGMLTHTPDELQFICLDFGGGTLTPFERAPHVIGVAGRNDPQRVRRALAEVRQLVGEREAEFNRHGIDSAASFRRLRAAGKLPEGVRSADLFLVVDNWGAVRGEVDGVEPLVLEVANRGLGVAVHLVLTANRWADIRVALRDSISARLELRLNDPSESEINRRAARQFAAVAPGRGMAPPGLPYQAALPRIDGADTADGLADAQQDALDKIAAAWSGPAAPPIRMLPERVGVRQLTARAAAQEQPAPGVPIGLGESDLAPVHLDLTRDEPHFLVFGDSGSGKSAFLRTWMTGLVERNSAWDVRLIVVDYRRSLLGLVPKEHLGAYAGDAAAARDVCRQVAAKLTERLAPPDVTPEQLRERSWWTGPEFYLVVDDFDLVGSGRQTPLSPLAEFLPQARELGLHVVLARRVGGSSRSLVAEPFFTQVRELGADGLILSGDPREGVLLGDQRAAPRPPGRGVLLRRKHQPALIQVALTE